MILSAKTTTIITFLVHIHPRVRLSVGIISSIHPAVHFSTLRPRSSVPGLSAALISLIPLRRRLIFSVHLSGELSAAVGGGRQPGRFRLQRRQLAGAPRDHGRID